MWPNGLLAIKPLPILIKYSLGIFWKYNRNHPIRTNVFACFKSFNFFYSCCEWFAIRVLAQAAIFCCAQNARFKYGLVEFKNAVKWRVIRAMRECVRENESFVDLLSIFVRRTTGEFLAIVETNSYLHWQNISRSSWMVWQYLTGNYYADEFLVLLIFVGLISPFWKG